MGNGPATVVDAPVERHSAPSSRVAGRLLVAAPDLAGAAVAGFAIGPLALLLTGHFSAVVAIPLGLVGAAIACRIAGVSPAPVSRSDVRWTVAAAAIAVCWFAYNAHYTAQDVYTTRDPSAYLVTGQWLVHHGSLVIETHPEVFGSPSGRELDDGTSFNHVSPTELNAQGVHLLPVFLGLSGSVFGNGGLLAMNTALAAIALLVLFGLARRIVGPALGLVATATLAVSMPMIYLGRDAYTEPLTLLFLAASLTYAHRGHLSGRWADWAIAGLAGGAATCVRADSYGSVVGVVVAAVAFVASAHGRADRARAVRGGIALLGGAALPLLLGWLDLTHLSRQYFGSQHGNITHLILLLALVTAAGPVVVWLAWRTRMGPALAGASTRVRITRAANAGLVVVFAALAVRPLWQTTHGPFHADLVNMQLRWHASVDGTRTYNEQTVHWLEMYFGWPTVLLAVAGYALMISAVVRRRAYALTGVVATGLSMSALYLWNSEVSPDQPWAMRRYVPVVLPVLLVAASVALRALWRRRGIGAVVLRPAVLLAVVTMIAYPLAVSWPMRHVRDEVPQLSQLRAVCTAVGPRGAVLVADLDTVSGYAQSIRSFCGVPVIGLVDPSPAALREVAAAVTGNGRKLFVLTQKPAAVPYAGAVTPDPFSRIQVSRWPNQINKAPDVGDVQFYAVYLSTIDPDGLAHEVAPVRSGS